MTQPAEESVVITFAESDLRLCHLGLMQDRSDRDIAADPLYARLGSASNVLGGRRKVASIEANLRDPAAPLLSNQYQVGLVSVRLRAAEITRLIEGLDRFLARSNPAMNGDRLVDPPASVRPLLDRLRSALGSFALKADLARRERDLLA